MVQRVGHQPRHVVSSVEVKVDGLGEHTEVCWCAVALHDPLCDPEAAVGDYCVAQLAKLIGLLDGTQDAVLAGDVGADENRPAAQ